MPVKWTPEMDQLLLLKILETCDVNADAKKISTAWPTDCPNGLPTARAITERLVKIRDSAKKNGAGHFNISSAQSKGTGTKRAGGGTPRKPRAANGSGIPGSGAGKRKRNGGAGGNANGSGKDINGHEGAENEDDEEVVDVKLPKTEDEDEADVFWAGKAGLGRVGNGNGVGATANGDGDSKDFVVNVDEVGGDGEDCMHKSPAKRAKREGTSKVDGYGSDGQVGGDRSVSEFADVA